MESGKETQIAERQTVQVAPTSACYLLQTETTIFYKSNSSSSLLNALGGHDSPTWNRGTYAKVNLPYLSTAFNDDISEVKLRSRVRLFATPRTVAYQAPPSMHIRNIT